MKEYLIWIGLFLLAIILIIPVCIIGFIWAMVRSKDRLKYIKRCAESLDQTACAWGANFFTDWWTNGNGYEAGDPDETLSSFNGKNQVLNTLSKDGWWFNRKLYKLDKDHCFNSIDSNP